MGKVVAILLLTLTLTAALTVFIIPADAESKTIVVPTDYPTIQQAINQANPGDTIYVKAGTYNGTIEITKSIALIGEENKAVINDWYIDGKAAILITSNNVTVNGITIDNPTYTSMWTKKRGIHLLGANDCAITHNIIRHCDSGGAQGIWLYQSQNNIITDNNVENGSIGISIGCSTNNRISNNTLRNISEEAICIYQSSNNTITSNKLLDDAVGFQLSDANYNSFLTNNITCYSQAISFNVAYGSYSTEANGNLFLHNNFLASTPYPYARVSHNLLGNPLDTQFSVIGTNYFDNGEEGNFYSGYSGKDVNHDGIGDIIYVISAFGNFSDNYPLMSPWVRDSKAPIIEVFSPSPEINLITREVQINFTINEDVSEIKYNLDGAKNITITGNITLNLSNGNHNVRIFASDLSGNEAVSKTIHFAVDAPVGEPISVFVVALAVLLIVVTGLSLILYYRRGSAKTKSR